MPFFKYAARTAIAVYLACSSMSFAFSGTARTYTEQQAIQEALNKSPDLELAKQRVEESDGYKIQARSTFLPSLVANANYLIDKKYALVNFPFGGTVLSIPQIIPTTSYGFEAKFTLFDGLGGYNRYRASDHRLEAAQDDLSFVRFATERKARLQFYRALATTEVRQLNEQNIATLKEHLEDTRSLKGAGIATQYDVLRTESQLSDAQSDLLLAADEEKLAREELALMLDTIEPIEAVGEIPSRSIDTKSIAPDQTERLDLAATGLRDEAANQLEVAARAHWFPKVQLVYDLTEYNNLNNSIWDPSHTRNAYTLGLLATWALFEGGASSGAQKAVAAQREQADVQFHVEQLKAGQQIAFWKRKYEQQSSLKRAKATNVARAKEAVRLAHEGQRAGVRTNSDLLDTELDLFRSQVGLVNASLGVQEAILNLELAVGHSLENL